MAESYEKYVLNVTVSRKTGKVRKRWMFVIWSPIIENLDTCPHKQKGDYLVIEVGDEKVRYKNK